MRRVIASSTILMMSLTVAVATDDVDHGRQLAERWCAACHAVGTEPTRFRRAQPFVAIAARENVTKEMLVKFLQLPHATMANNPLTGTDAADLAGYVLSLRK